MKSALCLGLIVVSGAVANIARAEFDFSKLFKIIGLEEVTRGDLVLRHETGLYIAPKLQTEVRVSVTGMIARTTVRQTFRNPSDEIIEGIYAFPLPDKAAVDRLRMVIGSRVIEGKILEREEARKTYEKAKRENKKASLVEQHRPNLFTTSVANIGPNEQVEIIIQYQQTLRYDGGQFTLRYPLTFKQRYGSNPDKLPSISKPIPTKILVQIDAGVELEFVASPTHSVRIKTQENIKFVELAQETSGDKDFVLNYRPKRGAEPKAALFTEVFEDEVYALMMVLPPLDSTTTVIPKETVFIVDTSGSMSGRAMDDAKAAVSDALQRIGSDDRFNIVEFDNDTHALFEESQHRREDSLAKAQAFVSGLHADGGTEMLGALQQVLPRPIPKGYVRQVVFITDGAVNNERELFGYIEKTLGEARLFTIGIGTAPNVHFMRNAAQFGRGTFTFIDSPRQVRSKMQALFQKLSKPALTDLQVNWNAPKVETWPKRIPDLYYGEPMIVTAKLPRAVPSVQAQGKRGALSWKMQAPIDEKRQHPGVAKLWAREKIKGLMDSLSTGASPLTVKEKVTAVALQHGLVSQYTSLVAVDQQPSSKKTGNKPQARAQMRPRGAMPRTGLGTTLMMLIGLALTGLGLLGGRRA